MPEYGSKEYWNTRFTQNDKPFDWLQSPQFLCNAASYWVGPETLKKAEVLHIGCGTSDCSTALREIVSAPRQVHNVDFSQAAIDAASQREDCLLNGSHSDFAENGKKKQSVQTSAALSKMRWTCLDLLSLHSTLDLIAQQTEVGSLFDLVLDKGTSDSIALLPPSSLRLPYAISVNGWTSGISQTGTSHKAEVHPLHLLAVHLAALSPPQTGKWLSVSYSEERFPFLPPLPQSISHGLLQEEVINAGFPHPAQLWRLEAKERVELRNEEETLAQRKNRSSSGMVHRPNLSHWLYVLVRTEVVVTY